MKKVALAIVAVFAVAALGRIIDYPSFAGGHKGDEATYILMAFSVARDHDLVYTKADLDRFDELYHRPGDTAPRTPQGLFLRERYDLTWSPIKTARPDSAGLAYGKAFIYPLFAAPFAWIGGLWGMFVFNIAMLLVSLACAIAFARARVPGWKGVVLGAAFVLASDVPVWTVWLTSELFNFTCVMTAYFLWLYKFARPANDAKPSVLTAGWTDWAAALLLGFATFSKPSHALLIVPLGLFWLSRRNLTKTIAISAAFLIGSAGCYGLNGLQSGLWNYQGAAINLPGGRQSFYRGFPFAESGKGLRNVDGSKMETNDSDTGTVLSAEVLQILPRNIFYLLFGRDAGLVPYYFPCVMIAGLWLLNIRRSTRWQWLSLAGALASVGALLLLTPITWNGGGGPPGNRYFLGLYPPFLFLLPAAVGGAATIFMSAAGLFFTARLLVNPFDASHAPWIRPGQWPLRILPTELTMMNDLPVRLNEQRGHIRFRDQDPRVDVYYMDQQSYDAEGQGFWIAPGAPADVVFRVYPDITQITMTVHSDIDNVVTGTAGGRTETVALKPGERKTMTFDVLHPVHSDGADVHEISISAAEGVRPSDHGAPDTRNLGAFVELGFVLRRR